MTNPKTGANYAAAIRHAAHEKRVTLLSFLALAGWKPTFLHTLEIARSPKPFTIARIEALIAGQPMPKAMREIRISVSKHVFERLHALSTRSNMTAEELAASLIQYGIDEGWQPPKPVRCNTEMVKGGGDV